MTETFANADEAAEKIAAFIAQAGSGSIQFRSNEGGIEVSTVKVGEEPAI